MPKRSDAGPATLEPVTRPPAELAAEFAAKSESLRRESLLTDWAAWREIVGSIAAGREPSGEQLADIALLAERLRLPAGALSDAVAAVVRQRELELQLSQSRQRMADADRRAVELKAEVEVAENRLRQLRAEQQLSNVAAMTVADLRRSLDEHVQANPIAFLDVAELVSRSIAYDAKSNGRPT